MKELLLTSSEDHHVFFHSKVNSLFFRIIIISIILTNALLPIPAAAASPRKTEAVQESEITQPPDNLLPGQEPAYLTPPSISPATRYSPDADEPDPLLPPKPTPKEIDFRITPDSAFISDDGLVILNIFIQNNSQKDFVGLIFQDNLENGFDFVANGDSPVTYDSKTRAITYTIGVLRGGGVISFSYGLQISGLSKSVNGKLLIHTAELMNPVGVYIKAQTTLGFDMNVAGPKGLITALSPESDWYPLGDVSVYVEKNSIIPNAILTKTTDKIDKNGPEIQFKLDVIETDQTSKDSFGNQQEQTVLVGNEIKSAFSQPAYLEINLDNLVDLREVPARQEVYIAVYDEIYKVWVKIPIVDKDYDTNTVTVRTNHFSTWGAGLGSSLPQNGANVLLFNQPYTSLFNGAAGYSIPIWTPAGRAGLAPSISLSYSSSTFDGVLGDVQAPWVGAGWNIDGVEIVRKITTSGGIYGYENNFSLTLNGSQYELMQDEANPSRYYVKKNGFLYIERHNFALDALNETTNSTGEWWEVITTDGMRYRLGFNTDSEQLAPMYGYACTMGGTDCNTPDGTYGPLGYAGKASDLVALRWRMDRVTDTHGNYISYEYSESQPAPNPNIPPFDRESYLYRISYTGFERTGSQPLEPGYDVRFVHENRIGDVPSAFNVWDNVDSRQLDKIEIYCIACNPQSPVLVRTYDLKFSVIAAPNANGSLVLDSLKISGGGFSENSISLPATESATMFFSYQAMPNRAGGGTDYKYPRLVTIDNGYGATLTYTYETDGRGTDSWYSYRVKQVDVNSGMGLATVMKYAYQTPVYTGLNGNANLGELIGYTYTTETTADYTNGNVSILDIKHQFGTTGLDKGKDYSTEWLVGGTSMRKVVNTYVTDNSKAPFVGWNYRYLSQVENYEKIGSSLALTSKAIYRRDPATGNLLVQEDYLGRSLYRKTYYEYTVNTNPSVYILDTLSRKVLVDSSYLIYSDTRYYYDNYFEEEPFNLIEGNLILAQTLSGVANNTVDTQYVYDVYGNVTHAYSFEDWGQINQPPDINNAREITTAYDNTLHTYPVSVSNPLNQSSATEYLLSLGIPYQSTDPNGWITRTSYDGLGRTLSVTPPGLSEPGVWYEYPTPGQNGRISTPYSIEIQILDDPAGVYRSVWGIYDGLGRILQNQVYNADDGILLLTEVSFNPQGLTFRQSDPHEANWPGGNYMNPTWPAGTYSSYLYDELGRNTKVTTSGNLVTETSYSGLTTTVKDPNGNLKSNTSDGLGRLIRVGEYNGTTLYATTQYSYNIADQLVKVTDANSNITTIQYNRLGQKTSMVDPDMGNWTYDYYPSGNLKLQEDANGQQLKFVYDKLNRLVEKRDNLTNSQLAYYRYGDIAGQIGMRIEMTNESGSTSWEFANFGRTVTETRTIDTTEKSSTSSSDWLGRVLSITYPDGEMLSYHYDALGRPDHLTSDGSTMVDLAYNALGQITSSQLGNGVTVTNDYDSNQRLESRVATDSSQITLMSFGYNYDNNGNILSLTDSTLGETTTYTYDGLNRLKSAWDVHDSQDIYRQTFNYDKIGKLLQVSTLGNVAQQPIQASHKVMAALIPLDFDISQSLSRGDSIGLFDDPPTETPTETPTFTNTSSPTETVTATYTPTDTPTLTHTASSTATYTPTATRTPTPTRTASVPTNTSQPTVTPSYTPTLTPYTTGVGLTGEYYDNDNLTWLKVVRTDATINFNWGTGSPDASIGADSFSARWRGLVMPRYSETYTFRTETNDGVRLWVNNQLIIDSWGGGGTYNGTIALTAGVKYDIKMEYKEVSSSASAKLSWYSLTQAFEVIPQSQLFPPSPALTPTAAPANGVGLTGEYYDNDNLTWLRVVRTDATIDFNWGSGSPDASIGSDSFSVRWRGQILPRYSETYTIKTVTDDGVRLWVNNQPVIDNWGAGGTYSGTISLTEGVKYDIKMEYKEVNSSASARLYWSSWTQPEQIIPQSQLFPPTPTLTPTATPANGFGLKGEYYDNSDLTNLKIIRNDPYVNFYWGNGSPDSSIGADTFSVRWTGQVQPRYSETYTFKTVTDDGVRLWVNNQQLINNWAAGGTYSGTIALTAGLSYDIKMEYKENTSTASAYLYWSSWTQPEQIIPQSQLFAPLPTPTPTSAYWAGLVGFWNFNDGTGADSSGRGHPANLGGSPIVSNGASGSALSLNGTAAWVSYHSDFNPTNGFSLSAWLNPSQLSGSTYRTEIILRRVVNGSNIFGLYFDTSGNLLFEVNGLSPMSIVGPRIQFNQWSLVTAVYDKNGGQLKIYINGDLASVANVTGTANNDTTTALSIGGIYPTNYYKGKIDEIHFYNRPLTSSEIQQLISLFPTPTPVPSQTPTSIPTPMPTMTAGEFGTGTDGDRTVTGTVNLNTASLVPGRTCADAPAYSVTQLYGNTAVLSESPAVGCLAPNDEILLINLRSDGAANTSVGKYEFLRVQNVNGSIVYFTTVKTKWYGAGSFDDTNIGIGSGQQRVVIQRVPNYNSLTVNGTLTSNAFDGNRYGVIIFKVAGTLSGSGVINSTSLGFSGGTGCLNGEDNGGNGMSFFYGPGTSGAGIGKPTNSSDQGPGGGGYATNGGQGQYNGMMGGKSYGAPELTRLFMGSGGGGCGCNIVSPEHYHIGSGGSAGGGIIYLIANTINFNGQLLASAVDAGSGGAGSGGSIRIEGDSVTLNTANVNGGIIGAIGSIGRIAVYYHNSFQANFTPGYVENDNGPVPTPTPTPISFADSIYGTGANGNLVVPTGTTFNINTQTGSLSYQCQDGGDAVAYSVTGLTADSTTLSVTPKSGCLNPGDEVLLINLEGTSSYYINAGNYEFLQVGAVSSNNVSFVSPKAKFYGNNSADDSNLGTGDGNQRVMLMRVPNYENVTIDGTLTANAYNNSLFGILAFRVRGVLSGSGAINTSKLGYRGGIGHELDEYNATPGESFGGAAPFNGAGGPGGSSGGPAPAYGGSAGFATYGITGISPIAGASGYSYGDPEFSKLFMGAGGGGGGAWYSTSWKGGANGGKGGGVIFIAASTADAFTGLLASTGEDGVWSCCRGSSGGGGAGGSIFFRTGSTFTGAISVAGGLHYEGNASPTGYPGGSAGRINLTANSQPDALLAEDFENGLSNWTLSTPGASTVSTSTDSAYWADKGLEVTVLDNSDSYAQNDAPDGEKSYNTSFYINTDLLKIAANDSFIIASGQAGTGDSFQVQMQQTTVRQIRLVVFKDDSSSLSTSWFTILPGWHAIEVQLRAARLANANDGSASLFLDSVLQQSLTNLDNDTKMIESERLGVSVVDTGTRGSIYYDDFESRRFSTIGMLPDPGSHSQNPVLNTFTSQPDAAGGIDAFMMDDAPTTNTGGYTTIMVGEYGDWQVHRGLIKFDLSNLPSNAIIRSVALTLTIVSDEATNPSNFCVYTLKRDWMENQATWNAYSTGNNWQTAGAGGANDYDSNAVACLSFGNNEPYGTQKTWVLTTAPLQAIVDGVAPNYGFLIRSGEGEDKYQFASSDHATASYRPKLVIEYTVATPEPTPTPSWDNVTYSYNDETRPHAVTGLSNGNSYDYDENGNMTCRAEDGKTYVHSYNAENRLAAVLQVSGNCTAQGNTLAAWGFTYDGDGNRVKQVYTDDTSTLTTYYFFGGAYEVRSDGTTLKYYAFAGQTIAMNDGQGIKYFLTDHLGSVVAVTDAAGALLSQQRYMPFGQVRTDVANPVSQTDFGYTSQRNLDAQGSAYSLGLMDYRARMYSPCIMQWTQPDTLIPEPYNPLDWNRYSYVRGNPIRYNDPSGHIAACEADENCKEQRRLDKLSAIDIMKQAIRKKFGIVTADSDKMSWNGGNLITAYKALNMWNDTLNGKLKKLIAGTTYTMTDGGDQYYGITHSDGKGITFHVATSSTQIPLINYLHETAHLMDTVPATKNVFSGSLPKDPIWVKNGYVDSDILLDKFAEPVQAEPLGESYDSNEYWADAAANYVADNFNLYDPSGKGLFLAIDVGNALNPYSSP